MGFWMVGLGEVRIQSGVAGNGTDRVEKAAFLGPVNMRKENKPSPHLDGSTPLRPPECLKNPFTVFTHPTFPL